MPDGDTISKDGRGELTYTNEELRNILQGNDCFYDGQNEEKNITQHVGILKIGALSYEICLYIKLKGKGLQFNLFSSDKSELTRPCVEGLSIICASENARVCPHP